MRIITSCLLACLILLVFSCGQGPVEPGSDTNVIMPLKIGNRWDGTTIVYTFGDSSSTATTLLLTKTTKINKEIWYVGEYSENSEIIENRLYSNRNDGLWIWYTNPDKPEGTPYLLAKYPAKEGDIYDGPFIETSYYKVLSTDTILNIHKDKYKCYSYVLVIPESISAPTWQSFWSPGRGQIKYEIRDFFSGTRKIWQLDRFSQ